MPDLLLLEDFRPLSALDGSLSHDLLGLLNFGYPALLIPNCNTLILVFGGAGRSDLFAVPFVFDDAVKLIIGAGGPLRSLILALPIAILGRHL